jgi:bifunctional oligoribonuclease and PAP phosphatase NrnA
VTGARSLDRPTEADWQEAVAVLHRADEVALVCHVSPDGDALGSMLGLQQTLVRLGKTVIASFGSPFLVPPAYAELPGVDRLVAPADFPPAPQLLVTFDTGSQDRLGSLADRVDSAGEVLVIDHHASNTRYGTLHLVDPTAAATAVLVEALARRLGATLDTDNAAPLYAALVTDTGSFKYAATTPETHYLAARLLATGIRHDLLSRRIWDQNPFGYVQLLGAALSRATLEPSAVGGLGLVWTSVSAAELVEYGLVVEQVEGIIDVIRTAEEAEVAVVCKQDTDGSIRVSARSKGRVDIGAACMDLGGGGHRLAAGLTSVEDVSATMARMRDRLDGAEHLVG